jgi:uncharacterized membrane protein (UPF0127 family)
MRLFVAVLFASLIALLIALLFVASQSTQRSKKEGFVPVGNRGPITVGSYQATVEYATTPDQLEKGLMHRTRLGEHEGMLFVFDSETPRSFWMRNTLIPLDMLFFNSNMELIKSWERVPPHSEEQRSSGAPAKYGLEVPAGTVARFGIQLGDRLLLG